MNLQNSGTASFSDGKRQKSRFFNPEDTKMRNEENGNIGSVQEEEEDENMRNLELAAASLAAATSVSIEKKMFADVQSVERLRTLVNNIIQSASRTSGQIRELIDISKIIERSSQQYICKDKDSETMQQNGINSEYPAGGCNNNHSAAFSDGEVEDDNFGHNGNVGTEVECLQQKVKSTKRKLRKWRQFARTTLSEICPQKLAEFGDDLTPGTLKTACDAFRELKVLAAQLKDTNYSLYHEIQDRDIKIAEMKKLIGDLLRNTNGIRVPVDFHIDDFEQNTLTPGPKQLQQQQQQLQQQQQNQGEIIEKEINEATINQMQPDIITIKDNNLINDSDLTKDFSVKSHIITDMAEATGTNYVTTTTNIINDDGSLSQLRLVYEKFSKNTWVKMGLCTTTGLVFGLILRPKRRN